MQWIPEIEPAYARYIKTFSIGFDAFPPVRANPQVSAVLSRIVWPASLPRPSSELDEIVTMDVLFELPGERLRYYKKLYDKLLKSTQEGKSDHLLLVKANEKLDFLLVGMEEARMRRVGEVDEPFRTSYSVGNGGEGDSMSRQIAQRAVGEAETRASTISGHSLSSDS
jgi:hypothetical protein